ncbi:MAG: DUF1592 domain-containing protein [Candidatus Binatia bacterium]|nr:DUF1592 domain-containing protein [Candidatus Binatia bacterium]
MTNDRCPGTGLRQERLASCVLVVAALATLYTPAVAQDAPPDSPRRLTRLEYGHTLRDLLKIDEDAALALGESLPPEADSGDFDTLAVSQGISGLHVRTYLEVADRALDAAILVGPPPAAQPVVIDYATAPGIGFIATGEAFGLGVVEILDDGALVIADYSCTYTTDSSLNFFNVPQSGRYRVTLEAYRYQADTTVVVTLFRGKKQGVVASLDELIGVWDLVDDETKVIEVTTFLQPGDLVGPCVSELDTNGGDPFIFLEENTLLAGSGYPGEGIVFKSMTLEGPLQESWPPPSTRSVLVGVDFGESGNIQLTKSPEAHLDEIVANFAERAFRRPVEEPEIAALVVLGLAVLDEGRPFLEAVRVPLSAVLSSPEFLYQPQAYAPGQLTDHELATRLAYFVWRSAPDDELLTLAQRGALSDPATIRAQVDRMLDDPKSWRFVEDFATQAYRLDEIRATTPSPQFSYEERLGQAMEMETKLFLAELIREDLSVANLIDSDFTYMNRRLASLYEVQGIEGQEMRRVSLPADSPRGGLLTQGSILKLTSNGTNTSPVPRGNFVLGPLLGTPTPPPPPGVTGLEPDTRGTTTIREQLDAHRTQPVCNSCHSVIDPPGFALEQFDPVGALREFYRPGVPVDATGVTTSGRTFDGIAEYKEILLDEQLDQVGRNLVSQLLVFGTGAAIQTNDRTEVNRILAELKGSGYGFRSTMRTVAASSIFRRR